MTQPVLTPGRKQRGVLIVALMAGIAIMMILSTVAVQAWADIARRDAEAEMIFRAQDIVRALKRFQMDRGKLPNELKELLEVGSRRPQYFIRQLWKDPLVKGGKWQLIYANPAGGFIDPTVTPVGGPNGASGLSGGSGFGSLFGTSGPNGSTGHAGQPSIGLSASDSGFPSIGKEGGALGELTGLPIAGVKSKCKDRPFRKYREKTDYAEWVFTIFDLDPRPKTAVTSPAGTPPGGQPPPTPVTPSPPPK